MFASLFGSLPSAPKGLKHGRRARFSVRTAELDLLLLEGWSCNTLKTPTTCIVDPEHTIQLLGGEKVFYDHSQCPRCTKQSDVLQCVVKRQS